MNAMVEINPAEPSPSRAVVTQPMNPMQMLGHAIQQGMPIETLRELMQLKKEWEADEARKAFVSAMAAFKANPPEIVKDKHVSFQTSKGITEYDHATLGGLCASIIKGLAAHGISHRWETAQQDGRIKVTCVLTHSQGHSESVSLHSAADDSGGKNSIQAIGSAVTYLQRYTLLAATGLAALDQDDDGKGADQIERITEKQAADLNAKISEVGANKTQFLKFLKVEKLSDLEAKRYTAALQALEDKARGNR
jgi:ERF superfamily protein